MQGTFRAPARRNEHRHQGRPLPRTIILGTGHAVPTRVVTNADLAKLMDTSDEWIVERSGIRQRHWVTEGETGVELARGAATEALAMAGLDARDIDAIVYASSTPDHFFPGNSVYLQHEMGMGRIPAFNVVNACSGFVYAMQVADALIITGAYRRILIIGQEIQSTRLNTSDAGRATSVLFADGAGAAVLGPTEDPDRGVLGFDLHGDGAWADRLWVDGPGAMYHPPISQQQIDEGRYWIKMEGREVFKQAVTRMPETVETLLARLNLAPTDIALLIPHQANLRISEAVQKRLGLRDDQVFNNIERFGNTTAATIPIALDECVRAGRLAPGDLLVLTAFGSGFQWGSCAIRW